MHTCSPGLRSDDLQSLGIGDLTADDRILPAYVRRYPGSEETEPWFSGTVCATTILGPSFTEPVSLKGDMQVFES